MNRSDAPTAGDRALAQLRELGAALSHDVQAPLRSVVMFAQLLERSCGESLSPKELEYLGFVRRGGDDLIAIVNGLLYLTRLGESKEAVEAVDLVKVVQQSVEELRYEDSVELNVECAHLPTVFARRTQLQVAFKELLTNASKFRKPERPLRVFVSARPHADGFVQVRVEDNGIGIPHEQQHRLFRLFRRLHASDSYPGLGMGLATVRWIIEGNGGAVSLDAELQTGTAVCVTLATVPEHDS